jgi:hypothetical protein
MTIQSLDPSILDGIEGIAKDAAASMKESGSVDVASVLPQMMSKVGSLMGVDSPDPNDPAFQNLLGMMSNGLGNGGMLDGNPMDPMDPKKD